MDPVENLAVMYAISSGQSDVRELNKLANAVVGWYALFGATGLLASPTFGGSGPVGKVSSPAEPFEPMGDNVGPTVLGGDSNSAREISLPETTAAPSQPSDAPRPKVTPAFTTYPWVAQEAGRLQEKLVSAMFGWPKNEQAHETETGGSVKPDYMPKLGTTTGQWATASKPEEALFVADSKYRDETIVKLDKQMKGFIELASRTNPPSGKRTLILVTNPSARVSKSVVKWAGSRGVTVLPVKQNQSK